MFFIHHGEWSQAKGHLHPWVKTQCYFSRIYNPFFWSLRGKMVSFGVNCLELWCGIIPQFLPLTIMFTNNWYIGNLWRKSITYKLLIFSSFFFFFVSQGKKSPWLTDPSLAFVTFFLKNFLVCWKTYRVWFCPRIAHLLAGPAQSINTAGLQHVHLLSSADS